MLTLASIALASLGEHVICMARAISGHAAAASLLHVAAGVIPARSLQQAHMGVPGPLVCHRTVIAVSLGLSKHSCEA